jgi:hypothetical protein
LEEVDEEEQPHGESGGDDDARKHARAAEASRRAAAQFHAQREDKVAAAVTHRFEEDNVRHRHGAHDYREDGEDEDERYNTTGVRWRVRAR